MKTEKKYQESVVDAVTAEQEFSEWLDAKKVSNYAREEYRGQIEKIVDAIQSGMVTINEDQSILIKLREPIQGQDITTSEILFQPRAHLKDVQRNMKGVKSDDADGRMAAYIAAYTRKPRELYSHMEMSDFMMLQSIVVFVMS